MKILLNYITKNNIQLIWYEQDYYNYFLAKRLKNKLNLVLFMKI